jgi:hypothetical protein
VKNKNCIRVFVDAGLNVKLEVLLTFFSRPVRSVKVFPIAMLATTYANA